MRFLMLNWRDPRNPRAGGAERVTQGYMSALARRGHEVYWFANQFSGAKNDDAIEGIKIVRGGGIGSSIVRAWQWRRGQPPFDLVIDQHHGIPWFAPWWCRTRCVAYIHEVLGPIWSAFYPWPLSAIGRWQERWTHSLYRRVPFWTACQSTADCLRKHGVRDITILPYGVHTLALPRLDPKPLTPPLRLIVVSRLAPNKRIEHAVQTLRRLKDQHIEATLKIVGTGDSEASLRRLVSELQLNGGVTFTGSLPEEAKDRAMREAHFLLHTSQREGWGLNVIEANAMGTPAAVYPVPGLVESTLHDETGLVSSEETPASLAASLARILAQPEKFEQYRSRAWERAKSFHWNLVMPQACDWLEEQARRPIDTESRRTNRKA